MRERGKNRPMKSILAIAWVNYESWVWSPRTVLMPVFIAAICYLQMCGYESILQSTGFGMHYIETMFYEFSFGCNMPMTTALFLIMVSELPRRMIFQQYILIRSHRWHWLAAQILYCLMMVLTMLAVIFLFMTTFALPLVTPGEGWSDMERIAAGVIEPEMTLIDLSIIHQFSPAAALIAAMIPVFCFWFTMVLVILLFGIWGHAVIGLMIYASLMVAHVTIYFECFPFPVRLPMHYATLMNIMSISGQELEQLCSVIGGYVVIIVALIAIMMASVRYVELDLYMKAR